MKTQLKLAILIGMIALFTVGGLVAYQSINQSKEEINLTHLIEVPYEVLKLNEIHKKDHYEVYLVGNLDYTNEILLSTKIQKEISNYYGAKNASLHLHLYDEGITLSDIEDGVDLNTSTYKYTLQTMGSTVIKYEPLSFKGIEGEVTASGNWSIENSMYNEKKELTFTTNLKPNLSNEAIFSTVKGISAEMSRHNHQAPVKQLIPINEEVLFYHDSAYPYHLIQETILVGRESHSLSEGVEE